MSQRSNIYINFLWRLMERIGAQGVSLLVSIVLARLLDPSAFGVVAMITVVTSFLQVFLDGGFSIALIQKKDADDLDFSSVFYFNVVFSLFLYAVLYFISPMVASFYQQPSLTQLLRALGLTLIVFAFKSVQQAYVSRHMMFKKFFFSTLGGTIGAAFIGIGLAYAGYGAWALVIQNIVNMLVDTIVLWIVVKWRPRLAFSWKRLKTLLSFGWKILVADLLEVGYRELRQLVIGKMYSSGDLAYYNRGRQFPDLIITNVNTSLDSILLPSLSNAQSNTDAVREMMRRSIKTATYIMSPFLIGLFVCAEPLVDLLLTEKWLPCVPYLRIFCVTSIFYPINTSNISAYKALGRSDITLILGIIKKVLGIAVLIVVMRYGPLIIAYSLLFTSLCGQIINSFPSKKLMNYSYGSQLKDLIPNLGLSLLMGGIVYLVTFIGLNNLMTLLIQIPLGVGLYILFSKLFHVDSYLYILETFKEIIYTKKSNKSRGED